MCNNHIQKLLLRSLPLGFNIQTAANEHEYVDARALTHIAISFLLLFFFIRLRGEQFHSPI